MRRLKTTQTPTSSLDGEAVEDDTTPIAQAKSKHGEKRARGRKGGVGKLREKQEVRRDSVELYLEGKEREIVLQDVVLKAMVKYTAAK